jgi:hypothetical protein
MSIPKMQSKYQKKSLLRIIQCVSFASLWPSYTVALNNLAAVVSDGDEAEKHLRAALRIDPGHANSLFNVALLLRYN